MEWNTITADPVLSELPYKIELNEWGKIEMSPASNQHGMLQTAIAFQLKQCLQDGKPFVECSIQTSKNVKVADVVWGSDLFFATHSNSTPLPAAPEIVVEVASPSNTIEELLFKKDLYLEKEALEFWLCSENGAMSFYNKTGKIVQSLLCPDFPLTIEA